MKTAIAILIAGLLIAIVLLWHGYDKGPHSSSSSLDPNCVGVKSVILR